MGRTTIEWLAMPGRLPETWNPTRGCSKVGPGCRSCWAETMAGRMAKVWGSPEIVDEHGRWTGKVAFVEHLLSAPFGWREPRACAVSLMSDLGHENLSPEHLAAIFGVMAVAGAVGAFHGDGDGFDKIGKPFPLYKGAEPVQMRMPRNGHGPHTFLLLTKRPDRLRSLLTSPSFREDVASHAHRQAIDRVCAGGLSEDISAKRLWPLPNAWVGTSIEDRDHLSRLDALREIPAVLRFVSFEPLLEDVGEIDLREIDWVIAGGESGLDARPCRLDWLRSIRDQCGSADVPFFCKQLGSKPLSANRDDRLRPKSATRAWSEPSEWPGDLQVRQFPEEVPNG